MAFRDLHVPSAGTDLGELMSAEGYTEADLGPPEPCAICEEPDGDCCSCYDEDESDLSESGNFDRHWYLD